MKQLLHLFGRVGCQAFLVFVGLVGVPGLNGLAAQAQAPPWVAATAGSMQALNGTSAIQATAADASGNVLVAGYFTGQVAFGSTVLTSAGLTDMFVAKWLPATNTWAWARRGGGTRDDQATAIVVSGSRVYVAGSIYNDDQGYSGVTFNGFTSPNGQLAQYGAGYYNSADLFVAAYTDTGSSGTLSWVQVGGGNYNDSAYGLAASGNRVYVTGYISNNKTNQAEVVFGGHDVAPGYAVQVGVSTNTTSDIVVAQYLDTGSAAMLGWTQVGGGAGQDIGLGIAVNGSRVYITGGLVNNLANGANALFGGSGTTAGIVGQAGAGAVGSTDLVLACYTDHTLLGGTGASVNWTLVGGGNDEDRGQSVAVQGNKLYVAGFIKNNLADVATVRFGGSGATAGTAQQHGATPALSYDGLMAQYTDQGASAILGWTQVAGGTDNDYCQAVAVQGNAVYAANYFTNDAANSKAVVLGGSGTVAGLTPQAGLGSYPSFDAVVARYTDNTSTGGTGATLCWTQIGGGSADDCSQGLALSGNTLYVGGFINSAVSRFGTAPAGVVAGTTGRRGFVASLVDNALAGTWQGAGAASIGGTATITATATDASGNVFVTGSFTGEYAFGPTVLQAAGGPDMFVAKYVPATGTWAWATSGGGSSADGGQGIAVNGRQVYVAGYCTNDLANTTDVLLGGTGPATSLIPQYGASPTATRDLLVAAYTDNGSTATLRWAQVGGGTAEDQGYGITAIGTSVYVAGALTNTTINSQQVLLGGSGTAPGTTRQYGATATSSADLLVAAYTDNGPSGTLRWTQVGGGIYNESALGIAATASGVYLTGYLSNGSANTGQVVFGGTGTTVGTSPQLGVALGSTRTSLDLLVAAYTDNGPSGTLRWTQVGGGSANDYGRGIAVSGASVYVVGSMYNNLANSSGAVLGGAGLAPGTSALAGATPTSSPDVLLVKYLDLGTSAAVGWVQVGGGTNYDEGQAVAVAGNQLYLSGYLTNSQSNANGAVFGGNGTVAGTQPQAGSTLYPSQDVLVAAYTDNGPTAKLNWTQIGGGNFEDKGNGIAIAGQQIAVGGYCVPEAAFGSIILAGPSTQSTGSPATQSILAQLTDPVLLATTPGLVASRPVSLALYPNPAAGHTTVAGVPVGVAIQVFDASGRTLTSITANSQGAAELVLAPGFYVVRSGTQAARLLVK